MESCSSSEIRFLQNDYFIFSVEVVPESRRKEAQWSVIWREWRCYRKAWNECNGMLLWPHIPTTVRHTYRIIYFNARTYSDWTEPGTPLFRRCAYSTSDVLVCLHYTLNSIFCFFFVVPGNRYRYTQQVTGTLLLLNNHHAKFHLTARPFSNTSIALHYHSPQCQHECNQQ